MLFRLWLPAFDSLNTVPVARRRTRGFPPQKGQVGGCKCPRPEGGEETSSAVLLVFSISRRVKGKMSILIQFRKQMSHESGLEKRLVFTEL